MFKIKGDIIENTKKAVAEIKTELGEVQGALVFDCVFRKMEMNKFKVLDRFPKIFGFPMAGFHTHGETFTAHIQQTLTGLFIGKQR